MVITFSTEKNTLVCNNGVEVRERSISFDMLNALIGVSKDDFHKAFPACIKNVSIVYNKETNDYDYKHTIFVYNEKNTLFTFDLEKGYIDDVRYSTWNGKFFTTLEEARDEMQKYRKAQQLKELTKKQFLLKKKMWSLTEELNSVTDELAKIEMDIKFSQV